ncbi:MAG: hypothetical protein HC831_24100 [Chloroflexia bacterium]|nr:hypothetical protein [Chloroflexia bacterium]
MELVSDTTNKIEIVCGEKLFEDIEIAIKDGILSLDHHLTAKWSRNYSKIILRLHSKPFERINIRKPAKVFNSDVYKGNSFSLIDWGKFSEVDLTLNVEYCLIAMSSDNFGQFKIKGKAVSANLWGWGSANVRADSLITENCEVLHRGMGDVYVKAQNHLKVDMQFTGNIFYSGNPSEITIVQRLGTGNIYKLN